MKISFFSQMLALLSSFSALTEGQIEVSSFNTESPISDMTWCGPNDQYVFVLTQEGLVYRTDDRGEQWENLQKRLNALGNKKVTSKGDIGKVQKVKISPVDKNLIFFLGSKGINWYSEDCGETLKALNNGRAIHEFEFHPTQRNWALASTWTKCDDFKQGQKCKIFKEVYYTRDLGKKWVYLKDYVIQFAWAQSGDSAEGKIPAERIILSHDPVSQGHQRGKGWNQLANLYVSDTWFRKEALVLERGNKFALNNEFLYCAAARNKQQTRLYVSTSASGYKTFKLVKLPVKDMSDRSYTVIDSSERSVFLYVQHVGGKTSFGNIYASDSQGQGFALSLENAVRGMNGIVDFEKVQSLEGVFIANTYDQREGTGVSGVEQSSDRRTSRRSQKSGRTKMNKQNPMRTYITFNKGADWQLLRAPDEDSRNRSINCRIEAQCSLHLQSYSSNVDIPPYSQENAVGLIMGVGNVGRFLSSRQDQLNTYLSRDGGLTWIEIQKGAFIYELGDHGGIIVMAPYGHATTDVLYSWDEGLNWDTYPISDTPIEVENIVIEPKANSLEFILYGTAKDETQNKGILKKIDFTGYHEP